MSREEDLIRSTTHAIASTVREVPPLRLEEAPDELRSPARAPRRGRGRPRGWWSWGAPLTAAAVVVVLAIALVAIKDIPNGGKVTATATPTTVPGGVPRYYVALKQLAVWSGSNIQRNEIVAGDSLTGKTLATLVPPSDTTFRSVTAAADDRTFVVFAVTSSNGSFGPLPKGAKMTGRWYEVRLAPGTTHLASLTLLPVKAVTAASTGVDGYDELAGSSATALSGSGQALAVPEWTATFHGPTLKVSALTVKVFSVATGQLLQEWATNDPSVTALSPSLTWIDGDRELALVTRGQTIPANSKSLVSIATVREWPVAGPTSGDLVADSKVVWNMQTAKASLTTMQACVVWGSPVISADGKTFSCPTASGSARSGFSVLFSFHTYPLTTAAAPGRTGSLGSLGVPPGGHEAYVVWTSSSGGTLIGAVIPESISPAAIAAGPLIGVMSGSRFTPLRFPANLLTAGQQLAPGQIAF